MVTYICNQNHKFIHPTKIVHTPEDVKFTVTIPSNIAYPLTSIEDHACPQCHSIEYTEYVEPIPDITSVKSVPLEEVDGWLSQGYKVRELYAKTATLIKCEAKQP